MTERVPVTERTPAIERAPADNVTAVLGPTNTGKTHLAVERMLGYASGIIGLPLRLLAREIYDRVVAQRGTGAVALITGEEKILPANPRYYVCTVESMPLGVQTEFLAVDEIQLCADPDRGHVFTNRLLHARGRYETMFLGAETMRPVIGRLLPDAQFVTRPRFSSLSYAGSCKLARMPRRSAVVAFSADQVYGIAELIRRQRGGAAVVMGALSPRTRNAQVALYQSGEVDFLVATDAIGMGLNMDVNHVAFASVAKFDGLRHRPLWPAEVAQIAGRAGRYRNDGSFGTTGEAGLLDEALVEQVETHRFDPVRAIKWRNARLEFGSLRRLIDSLEAPPPLRGLGRTRQASDIGALKLLASDNEIARVSTNPDSVRLLWQVCQVPDFRKLSHDSHTRLLAELFHHVMSDAGVLPEDYIARQVNRLDRADGEIHTLAARIANIRTWTFVANRSGWLRDGAHWQGRTREVEDKLSDALHERLTQRFIDRRTSVLMRRLHQKEELMASLTPDGDVLVEDQFVGKLKGFRLEVDPQVSGAESKMLRTAAHQALQGEMAARAFRLERHARIDEGKIITVDPEGRILWENQPVARLLPGHDMVSPRIDMIADQELLSDQAIASLIEALGAWLARHIARVLEPLVQLRAADGLDGLSRGFAFQLAEAMGALRREAVAATVKELDQTERGKLRKLGVRFGERHIYLPALIKPAAAALKLSLWRVVHQPALDAAARAVVAPGPGLSSVPADPQAAEDFYLTAGFEVCGPRAVRIDMLDRLVAQLRALNSDGPFPLTASLWSPVGCGVEDFEAVIQTLGYVRVGERPGPATQPSIATPSGEQEASQTNSGSDVAAGASADGSAKNVELDMAEAAGSDADEAALKPEMPDMLQEGAMPAEAENLQAAELEEAEPTGDEQVETAATAATAQSDTLAEGEDAALAMQSLWRFKPKPRVGRDGSRAKAPGGRRPKPAKVRGEGGKRGGQKPHRQRDGKSGGKRPAKQMDPDSPFAALQKLKEQMKARE